MAKGNSEAITSWAEPAVAILFRRWHSRWCWIAGASRWARRISSLRGTGRAAGSAQSQIFRPSSEMQSSRRVPGPAPRRARSTATSDGLPAKRWLAGTGSAFDALVRMPKRKFDSRKWRTGSGTFVGSTVTQHSNFSIELHQEGFVKSLAPAKVSPKALDSALASPQQVHEARTLMGGLQWLASQTRPDLGAQVSLAQQAFPAPTAKDLRAMNQALGGRASSTGSD